MATQEASCRRVCEQRGYLVAKVFSEGESAKTLDRAEFEAMQDYCVAHRKTVAAVVVYNVSRSSRMTEDHMLVRAFLKRLGIQLLSATEPIGDSPQGAFLETIFSACAQFDNQLKAQVTKEGMRAGAISGK